MQLWTVWIQTDYIEVINMDNYCIEIPDSTNYTIRDIQEIINSQEFQGIIELYNSSDLETKRLGIKLLETFKDV